MQKVILIVFITMVCFNFSLSAQNALDKEIEAIVNQLVTKMNNNAAIRTVAVADFTNLNGVPTELGKFLAEEFLFALANVNTSFSIVDRSRVNALLKEAGLSAQGLLDPSAAAKLGKLKSIDVIIVGTMTATGNYIRVNAKAIKLESATIIAPAKGDISRTPTINELEAKELGGDTRDTIDPKKPNPKSTAQKTFKKDNILFELIGCKQSGQNIECSCRITSEGKDADLRVSVGSSRLIDSEGSDYQMQSVKIGNLSSTNQVNKTLVNDVSTPAVFSFGNNSAKVELISKIEINCTNGDGWYFVEMRNISVKQ